MKFSNKYLLLLIGFSLAIAFASCKKDNKPNEKPDQDPPVEKEDPEKEPENPPVPASEFAGYMFVLDQAQIPDLAGYEAEKDVPQAKLMAISPNGELHLDILAEKKVDVQLGFECKMQRVKDHFVIFAKKVSLKEKDSKTQVTVINNQTLQVVSQTTYDFNSGYPGDFMLAATEEKAFIGHRGVIYTLDLKDGSVNKFADCAFDSYAGAASYNGSLFVPMKNEASIGVFTLDNNQGTKIELPNNATRIYPLTDTVFLAKSDGDECYLVSMESMKVIKTINMKFSGLQRYSMVYDSKGNKIYVAGQGKDKKHKVYFLDINKEESELQEMYIVPESDINMNHPISGNIKIGLDTEKNILYIGHLDNLVFADKVPPATGKRATRSAYISSISLEGIDGKVPVMQPAAKSRIEDMYEFSRFYYMAK